MRAARGAPAHSSEACEIERPTLGETLLCVDYRTDPLRSFPIRAFATLRDTLLREEMQPREAGFRSASSVPFRQ